MLQVDVTISLLSSIRQVHAAAVILSSPHPEILLIIEFRLDVSAGTYRMPRDLLPPKDKEKTLPSTSAAALTMLEISDDVDNNICFVFQDIRLSNVIRCSVSRKDASPFSRLRG